MMKAILTMEDDTKIVLVGLSHANLDRLRAQGLDGCIKINGADLGIPHDIVITAAKNEHAMLDAFQGGIGPNTKLHISDKLKS